jgi:hypothetical protein
LFALRPLSFIRSLRPSPQRQRQRQRERERERERDLNEGGRSNEYHVIITQNPNKI